MEAVAEAVSSWVPPFWISEFFLEQFQIFLRASSPFCFTLLVQTPLLLFRGSWPCKSGFSSWMHCHRAMRSHIFMDILYMMMAERPTTTSERFSTGWTLALIDGIGIVDFFLCVAWELVTAWLQGQRAYFILSNIRNDSKWLSWRTFFVVNPHSEHAQCGFE